MKSVIYKVFGVYYVTSEENYCARIRDERRVMKMHGFDSVEQIVSYFCRHFDFAASDFVVIDR